MKKLFVRHAELVTQGKIEAADFGIENGRISFAKSPSKSNDYQPDEIINAQGCYVTAGLFDLQVNGSPECNLWADPSASQFNQLCQLLLKAGVTGVYANPNHR